MWEQLRLFGDNCGLCAGTLHGGVRGVTGRVRAPAVELSVACTHFPDALSLRGEKGEQTGLKGYMCGFLFVWMKNELRENEWNTSTEEE